MFNHIFSADSLFSRFMNLLWSFILISLLWLVCAAGVVTLCPGTAAAYYAAAKCLRYRDGTVGREFLSSLRQNFAQGWPVSLLYVLAGLVLLADCVFFFGSEGTLLLLYLFYLLILLLILSFLLFSICMSRFNMSRFDLFRMSLAVIPRHLTSTIPLLVLLLVGPLAVFLMPWAVLVLPGLGFFLQTFLMEPVLLRYSPKPGDPGYDEDKWYYR